MRGEKRRRGRRRRRRKMRRASGAGRARLMAEECYDAFEQMAIDGWMDEWMITGDIRRSEEINRWPS